MIDKLDTTDTTDENVTFKINCLINMFLLIIMCLILLAIVLSNIVLITQDID